MAEQPQTRRSETGEALPAISGGRAVLIVCSGAAAVALIVGIIGGGIYLSTSDGDSPEPTAQETSDESGVDEPGTDDVGTADPATPSPTAGEPTTEGPRPGSEVGTLDEPLAPGTPFILPAYEDGDFEITVGEIDWDAEDAIRDAAPDNEEPAVGEVQILIPITVTYDGDDEDVDAGVQVFTVFVDEDGEEHRSPTDLQSPNTWLDAPYLNDGETTYWDVALTIPEDAVGAGTVRVVKLDDFEREAFVAAE